MNALQGHTAHVLGQYLINEVFSIEPITKTNIICEIIGVKYSNDYYSEFVIPMTILPCYYEEI